MIQLSPILLAILYALISYKFSAWKTKSALNSKSIKLEDEALEVLNNRMAKALDLPKIRVNIYEIPIVNGLAAPDGRIFITRGFIQKYHFGEISAAELATVIAHEIGHVALGHTRRRLIDFSGQNVVRVILTSFFGRLIPGLGIWIASTITKLMFAKLSRSDEYEADAYASALLIKSGIGIDPQITLFEKLEQLTNTSGNGAPAWLLSHPKTSERIKAIKKNEQKWKK
jgi:putative metalloprotease